MARQLLAVCFEDGGGDVQLAVLIKGGTLSFLNPHPQTNFCFMGLIVRVLLIRGWMSSQHEALREKVLCHIHECGMFFNKPLD